MKCDRPICPQTLWLIAAGWILLSLFVGETELLAGLPRATPQLLIVSLTIVLIAAYSFWPALRQTVDTWPSGRLIAVHLSRFVGIYFLFLGAHGRLDPIFARTAGWGDIVVASGAAVLLISHAAPGAVLFWNVVGLIDILCVVVTAVVLRRHNPEGLAALTYLPLSFLPTMIVPLIIATHAILFVRLLRRRVPSLATEPLAESLPL